MISRKNIFDLSKETLEDVLFLKQLIFGMLYAAMLKKGVQRNSSLGSAIF